MAGAIADWLDPGGAGGSTRHQCQAHGGAGRDRGGAQISSVGNYDQSTTAMLDGPGTAGIGV
jgi:hypothetical protein